DTGPVGADGHAVGTGQAVDAADRLLLHLDEREGPRRGVPVEDRERVVDLTGGVDVPAVRAHGHAGRPAEAGDAPGAVELDLEVSEVAGCGRPRGRLEQPRAEPRGGGQQEEAL